MRCGTMATYRFSLAHNKIRGFAGFTAVGNYDAVTVRSGPSKAAGAVVSLKRGDEVAVIGQEKGDIYGKAADWTAVIFNGRKRWVASKLLISPDNVPASEDEWLDFDGGFSRAKDWQFYFDLLRYLIHGVGNDS